MASWLPACQGKWVRLGRWRDAKKNPKKQGLLVTDIAIAEVVAGGNSLAKTLDK